MDSVHDYSRHFSYSLKGELSRTFSGRTHGCVAKATVYDPQRTAKIGCWECIK